MNATLETLINKHGLEAVLRSLANVCRDKSEHVLTNWQDAGLAGD